MSAVITILLFSRIPHGVKDSLTNDLYIMV